MKNSLKNVGNMTLALGVVGMGITLIIPFLIFSVIAGQPNPLFVTPRWVTKRKHHTGVIKGNQI